MSENTLLSQVLENQGNIIGYVNTVKIKNLGNDIDKNIKKDILINTKNIFIEFTTNSNICMDEAGNFNKILFNLSSSIINEDGLIFETKIDDSLESDEVKYGIILTGIKG